MFLPYEIMEMQKVIINGNWQINKFLLFNHKKERFKQEVILIVLLLIDLKEIQEIKWKKKGCKWLLQTELLNN